jgi:bacteriocin-like protein
MKLFASSQDTSSNAIQDTTIELSEQELNAISGGCGGSCGAHPIVVPVPAPPAPCEPGLGLGFGFGVGFEHGFGWNSHHCHSYHHCCRW